MSEDAQAPVGVSFEFVAFGWVAIVFRFGSETLPLPTAAYGTDALGDLIRLALLLAAGAPDAQCSFEMEPGELRMVAHLNAGDPTLVDLSVFELTRWGAPTSEGRLYLSTRCAPDDLASAIRHAAHATLESKGTSGYQDIWGWAFPERAFAGLTAALRLPRTPWGLKFPDDDAIVASFSIVGKGEHRTE